MSSFGERGVSEEKLLRRACTVPGTKVEEIDDGDLRHLRSSFLDFDEDLGLSGL